MRPLHLKLTNIGSHRQTELDMAELDLVVLSGLNGAGKSTILDAILYALYGETRGNANNVVTEGEDVGRVEFEFALGDRRCLVTRERSRKGGGSTTVHFEIDGAVCDGKGVKETNERIVEAVGMDKRLLRATAFCGQGDSAAFSREAPAERKAILTKILRLEHFEALADIARKRAGDVTSRADRLTGEMESARESAEQLPEIEAGIAELNGQITTAEQQRAGVREELEAAQRRRAAIEAEEQQVSAKTTELGALEGRRHSLEGDLAQVRGRSLVLEQTIGGRAEVQLQLAGAEAAAVEVARLQGLRDQDLQLFHEENLLTEKISAAARERKAEIARLQGEVTAAKRQHQDAVASLEQQIGAAKRLQEIEVANAEERLARITRQSELLTGVPCAGKPEAQTCPLIADARAAAEQFAGALHALNELRASTPWGEKESDLRALRASEGDVAAPQRAQLEALLESGVDAAHEVALANVRQRRAELGYRDGSLEAHQGAASKRPEWEARLREIERAEALVAEIATAIAKLTADLRRLETQRADLLTSIGDPGRFARARAEVEAEISRVQTHANALDEVQAVTQATLGRYQERRAQAVAAGERVTALTQEIAELLKRKELLDLLGNPARNGAFTKNGIPALLIDHALPEIEAAANDMLARLSDGRMAVMLRTQTETIEGKPTETLAIIVSDERGERPYETFSGGEQMIVDLAVRVGMSKLLAMRAGAHCEMLILDEAAAPLDANRRRVLVECATKLAADFPFIVVVTHVEELKDRFPARWEVTRDDQGSHIEVFA